VVTSSWRNCVDASTSDRADARAVSADRRNRSSNVPRYSVAADLQPECRYDQVVSALGGHGELVERPDQLRPALERAFASGKPALVNVLTDPSVVYPRKANLA